MKDESDTGQVVKVTCKNGVEYVDFHDVSTWTPKVSDFCAINKPGLTFC